MSRQISPLRLILAVTKGVGYRPGEISPVPSPTFYDAKHRRFAALPTSRFPYAGGFFTAGFQVLRRFLGLRSR